MTDRRDRDGTDRRSHAYRTKPTSAHAMLQAKQSRDDFRQQPKRNYVYRGGKARGKAPSRSIFEGDEGNLHISVANVDSEELSSDTKKKHRGMKSNFKKVFRHLDTGNDRTQAANNPQEGGSKFKIQLSQNHQQNLERFRNRSRGMKIYRQEQSPRDNFGNRRKTQNKPFASQNTAT